MSEHTKAFIDNLASGQNADAGEAFKDALRDKVASSLDQTRQDVASKIFSAATPGQDEAQPHSDPKPEYAGTNDRTDAIYDTQGQQITFEPNDAPQPEAEAPQAPVEVTADETQ